MKSLRELAEEAVAVQSASNLAGVAVSFARVVADLRYALPGVSTKQLNEHPICVLWADKIASLTDAADQAGYGTVSSAYAWVHELLREPGFCSCGKHGCHDVRHKKPAP